MTNKETKNKIKRAFETKLGKNTKIGKLQDEVTCRLYWIKSGQTTFEKQESSINMYCDEITYLLNQKNKVTDMFNSKLVKMLKEQTQSLRVQYIDKCVAYANSEYDNLKAKETAMKAVYCDYLTASKGVYGANEKAEIVATFSEIVICTGWVKHNWDENFHHDGYSRKYKMYRPKTAFDFFSNNWRKVRETKALKSGKDKWVRLAEKNAKAHYENSILKLALRIEKKELNQDKLKMVTSHIDVNIKTTITDGDNSVRAWTIIAEGEVQRPHYRYLVK